jgi:cell wall assembly regulator SMI1
MKQLNARVKADTETTFTSGASDAEIEAIETRFAFTFPASYREFLRAFNGGDFRFARLYRLSESGGGFFNFDEQYSHQRDHSARVRSGRLLPIGDDYSGNMYCFDLNADSGDEPPIVLLHRFDRDDDEPELISDSFTLFVENGLEWD